MTAFFIDTDNALGSPNGDVDDAYAIAALVLGGVEVAAISSVSGNTSEPRAYENNVRLCRLLGWNGPLLRAHEARNSLAVFRGRLLALGALTNAAHATSAAEVIVVGGTLHTRGRWPPLWPHEFNFTHDRASTLQLFASRVPLTIFPLDVARQLRVRERDLDAIEGELGEELRRETRRWFRRLLLARMTRSFSIYDLAAASYAIDESDFTFEETTAAMRASTFVEFGRGERRVKVCTALNAERLWQRFLRSTARALPPR